MLLAAAGLYKDFLGLLPPCLFHRITGLPCLTCGATRSVVSLSGFKIASSFIYNPFMAIFLAAILLFSTVKAAGFLFKREIILELTGGEKKGFRIAVLSLIILNWIYLIIAGI